MAGAPTVDLEMDWQGGMRFHGRCGPLEVDLDGDAQAGPSPVQAAAFGLASAGGGSSRAWGYASTRSALRPTPAAS
jgi:hypothetical protein